ncbi:MAG TPA: PAS domain S-box protein [Gammaproteobacteria bacterium]|nr:PAS domain S-box protein [Gammaproteobacteria bacterium]
MVTGTGTEEVAVEAMKRGAADYILKSTQHIRKLPTTIHTALEKQRLHKEHTRAIQALQESEARYQDLYEHAPDMFASIDESTQTIRECNQTMADRLGYGKSELIGRSIIEIYHPRCKAKYEKCLTYFNQHGAIKDVELQMCCKNGDTIDILANASSIRDENGEVRYSRSIYRDITERKAHERKLQKSLEGTIYAITKAIEARDPYTAGHERRVADLALAIGQTMGLDSHQLEGIRLGALIHDIGKIQLPAEILSKPTKLTALEYRLIQTHSQVGYEILQDIDFPWPIANIAHQHHERLDGSGYPQGLHAAAICLEARVVAVADVVEAISSHRPYRPGLGTDKALGEIRCGRGQQYDVAVVDACLFLFNNDDFSFKK